ncbi:MAG TPA: alpha-amylase family glycosyl hydrolase, partial [Bacilli bacterium]|nr:alpha-amylase family glycosyl hydrolase [Bacilli bacterium]
NDFREETIYFVMTARFYDGDPSNNVHCWDDAQAKNPDSDPAWRGDFKGLIEKLDYIKALGFSALWITPVVENASGYDYHGYHAIDMSQVDPRLEVPGATYQDLINAAHAKGMKIIQDVVFNHTSNFGEENLFPMFEKDYTKPDTVANLKITDPYKVLPDDYSSLSGDGQYGSRINAMKEDMNDFRYIYHHEKSMGYEQYIEQTGQIAGDCVDLNTENPYVTNYLIDAYSRYIDMGVDGFRVDTAKHISRLVFDKVFNPAFQARGGKNFFMFGEVCTRVREVWNHGQAADSAPFYTWKEQKNYPWATMQERAASTEANWYDNLSTWTQPTSSNHYLDGNNYRPVDYSKKSDLNVIDFPMHWNFKNAWDAFNIAKGNDQVYADATWNVTYVDSHDYAPDGAPEGERFNQPQDVWAENLALMFTFRGIPAIYYGSEIEFQKGKRIDVGPNAPLSETGRAYFGDNITGNVTATDFGKYTNASGAVANTLNHPLAKHIRSLNIIRRAVPALQKGQYSTDNVSGGMAYKRRFTDSKTDSFALVTVSGGATFNSIPNGTYIDAVTGDTKVVSNGSLSISMSGKGNVRVYVLSTNLTPAPGKVAELGSYIK